MGRPRRELQQLLSTMGAAKVYFQPPNGLKMTYPAIVYEVDSESVDYADNRPHRKDTRYQVTVIDRDPDTPIKDRIAELPLCSFNRQFPADDLNHYVYLLYY